MKPTELSEKMRESYVIKTHYDELAEVLKGLLELLDIKELHIMTYDDVLISLLQSLWSYHI